MVNTEIANGRHKELSLQLSQLDNKVIMDKLEEVFKKLNSPAKIDIVLLYFLQKDELLNIDILMPTETTTSEKFHLMCTKADMINIISNGKI